VGHQPRRPKDENPGCGIRGLLIRITLMSSQIVKSHRMELAVPSGNCRILPGDHDHCGPYTLLLYQREQSGGVLGM
jgi:hypothetical protein